MDVRNNALLKLLIIKAKNERSYSDKNYYEKYNNTMYYETYFVEKMKAIDGMTMEIQIVYKDTEKRERENMKYKIEINRLNTEIQRLSILNKKFKNTKTNFVKTQKEYGNELKDSLNINVQMISKINNQLEEIQRLLAIKEDKSDFFKQQMAFTNKNCVHKKTTLMLKRIEKKKEHEYYKALCKTILIQSILSNNTNLAVIKELTDKMKILKKQLNISVKNLKMSIYEADLCKSNILLQFVDSYYNGVDANEILKLITSIYNLIITIGYMCYWRSKATITKRKAELLTEENTSGKPIRFNFPLPLNQTIIFFPTVGVLSFKDYYLFLRAVRANKTIISNSKIDEGVKILQLKQV